MAICRGVTRGTQFLRSRITMGALNHCGVAEQFKNVASAFFNAVHFLSHDLSFEHGGAKLASHPERHLTRYAPGHMVLS